MIGLGEARTVVESALRKKRPRRFETVLAIRQLVIVALSGILREVLHELPIVTLGIVEVPTLAVGMRIGRRGLSVSGGLHSLAQGLNVIDLISKMIHALHAPVRCPGFLGLGLCWTQGNVGFLGANVYPSAAVLTDAFATHMKLRKRRLQETNHSLDVTHREVGMFKTNRHCPPPTWPKRRGRATRSSSFV